MNLIVQIIIDVLMQIMLIRIQQIIIINVKQKFFDFLNSSKFVDVVDIDDIDEIAINDDEQRFIVIETIDNIEYFNFIYENEKK